MIILALLQESERGFQAGDALRQLIQFVAWFAIFGPLGFRFVVSREAGEREPERELPAFDELRAAALRGAALIGLTGGLLLVFDLLPLNARNQVSIICGIVLAVAYAIARRRPGAWWLALLAGIVLTFQSIVRLRWATLVNPIHMTAAALWIGTLFVMVAAGLPAILRAPIGERRGALVAELVARFSPLALIGAGFLVASGVVTAWRHLGSLHALGTTAYGITLIVKLCFVAVVVALGAWNWRRMSPRLGTEEAAAGIRRSASAEVGVTAIVLIITAVLVSLPSPAQMRARRPLPPPPSVVAPNTPGGASPATAGAAPAPRPGKPPSMGGQPSAAPSDVATPRASAEK